MHCLQCGKETPRPRRFLCVNCYARAWKRGEVAAYPMRDLLGREGHPQSAETRAKISDGNRGKKRSDETKAKLRGHEVSEETRAKISAAHRGKPAHNKGVPMSMQQRAKLRWQNVPARRLGGDGYVYLYMPEHPRARKAGRVLEHLVIAEQMLGRSLAPNEHVHHRNADRADNRPENLVVLLKADHHRHHMNALWAERRAAEA